MRNFVPRSVSIPLQIESNYFKMEPCEHSGSRRQGSGAKSSCHWLEKGSLMQINLNGRMKTVAGEINLKNLIEQFCLDTRHVIAQVNGSTIKNPQWKGHWLKTGDSVELIHFVGGG